MIMSPKLNEERWFEEVLALAGSEVEVGLKSSGAPVIGKIMNTMFDSFILDHEGRSRVIRFVDISYLLPRAAAAAPDYGTRRAAGVCRQAGLARRSLGRLAGGADPP